MYRRDRETGSLPHRELEAHGADDAGDRLYCARCWVHALTGDGRTQLGH